MNLPDTDELMTALREVVDPEAGIDIVELGLVYGIDIEPEGVTVRMTMTSAACPIAEMMVDDVYAELERVLPRELPLDVQLVWEPPWTPERMSASARLHFGWLRGAGDRGYDCGGGSAGGLVGGAGKDGAA